MNAPLAVSIAALFAATLFAADAYASEAFVITELGNLFPIAGWGAVDGDGNGTGAEQDPVAASLVSRSRMVEEDFAGLLVYGADGGPSTFYGGGVGATNLRPHVSLDGLGAVSRASVHAEAPFTLETNVGWEYSYENGTLERGDFLLDVPSVSYEAKSINCCTSGRVDGDTLHVRGSGRHAVKMPTDGAIDAFLINPSGGSVELVRTPFNMTAHGVSFSGDTIKIAEGAVDHTLPNSTDYATRELVQWEIFPHQEGMASKRGCYADGFVCIVGSGTYPNRKYYYQIYTLEPFEGHVDVQYEYDGVAFPAGADISVSISLDDEMKGKKGAFYELRSIHDRSLCDDIILIENGEEWCAAKKELTEYRRWDMNFAPHRDIVPEYTYTISPINAHGAHGDFYTGMDFDITPQANIMWKGKGNNNHGWHFVGLDGGPTEYSISVTKPWVSIAEYDGPTVFELSGSLKDRYMLVKPEGGTVSLTALERLNPDELVLNVTGLPPGAYYEVELEGASGVVPTSGEIRFTARDLNIAYGMRQDIVINVYPETVSVVGAHGRSVIDIYNGGAVMGRGADTINAPVAYARVPFDAGAVVAGVNLAHPDSPTALDYLAGVYDVGDVMMVPVASGYTGFEVEFADGQSVTVDYADVPAGPLFRSLPLAELSGSHASSAPVTSKRFGASTSIATTAFGQGEVPVVLMGKMAGDMGLSHTITKTGALSAPTNIDVAGEWKMHVDVYRNDRLYATIEGDAFSEAVEAAVETDDVDTISRTVMTCMAQAISLGGVVHNTYSCNGLDTQGRQELRLKGWYTCGHESESVKREFSGGGFDSRVYTYHKYCYNTDNSAYCGFDARMEFPRAIFQEAVVVPDLMPGDTVEYRIRMEGSVQADYLNCGANVRSSYGILSYEMDVWDVVLLRG